MEVAAVTVGLRRQARPETASLAGPPEGFGVREEVVEEGEGAARLSTAR
jgi:hypothetical protein